MKKYYYMILLMTAILTFFTSCTEDSNPIKDDSNEGVIGEVYVSDDAYKFIGYGYDLLENYADPSHMKGLVFKSWALPDEFTVKRTLESGIFKTTSGNSISEYQSTLQENISVEGSYKMFSGAVKTNFKKDYYELNKTSYATVQYIINKYQIEIPLNYAQAEHLRPYMADQAVKDLNDDAVTPFKIFEMYGTHVLTGAVMGARLDFNTMMMSSDIKQGQSISVLAEAEYSSLFSKVNTSSKFKSDEERNYYLEHRQKILKTIGGNSEFGESIINKDDYDKWINSIGSKSVLCDYTNNGLIPIWEFCQDSTRKDLIKNAFKGWATARQIVTHDGPAPPRNCIVDVIAYNHDQGSYIDQNGMRYYKLDEDLNCGAKGKYIYLYYAVGLDNQTGTYSPITKLFLSYSNKESTAANGGHGLTNCGVDLNSGAKGAYIYLFKGRSTSDGDPIRGIQVFNQSKKRNAYSQPQIDTGYWDVGSTGDVPLDLNKGAGGDYIYLKCTKD